jgi:hypothetical protein
MCFGRCFVSRFLVLVATTSPGWAVAPTPEEVGLAHEWSAARFGDDQKSPSAEPPFTFTYDGRPSTEILKTWKTERRTRALDDARTGGRPGGRR